MSEIFWNPWHGCTKLSAGCKNCYVYRRDSASGLERPSSECRKNAAFELPRQKKRDGSFKIASGTTVYTCFTSDFLLADADEWRLDCWRMMREREDCRFIFFTKRIDRLAACLPPDWGDGYPNVTVGCTAENQQTADYRLPIFRALPIRRRLIVVEPMLERVDIARYLDASIEAVTVGGESGPDARRCCFDWILDLREQCARAGVAFRFHQTGARFVKDGREWHIDRRYQISQARRADIDLPTGGTAGEIIE